VVEEWTAMCVGGNLSKRAWFLSEWQRCRMNEAQVFTPWTMVEDEQMDHDLSQCCGGPASEGSRLAANVRTKIDRISARDGGT
jgi:hypothetical protein